MLPGAFDSTNVTARNYNTYYTDTEGRHTPEIYINICYEKKVNDQMVDQWYGCDMSKCVADSMSLSKACLSSNQFELGGCESSSFSITIHDSLLAGCVLSKDVSFKNRPIIVTTITSVAGLGGNRYFAEYIHSNSIYKNGIRLFTGFIDEISVDVENLEVSITAYDIFNLFDKTDGSRVWNLLFPGSAESKMNANEVIRKIMDRIVNDYRIPYSEPDIIKVTDMNEQNWTQLFSGSLGLLNWQGFVEVRNDSDSPLMNSFDVSRNLIVSKESQKVTIDESTNNQTTVTHKVNINMKSLDVEQIVQTVVKDGSSGEETTTSRTILAQLKEALPIPEPPEYGEPLVDQETVITITDVDAEGNETTNTYEGVRNYDWFYPAGVEDHQGDEHSTFIHCTIYIYQEAAKEHLLIQTRMQDEDTYDGEKETLAFSGNYISDKTSIRDILKSYCQLNGLFAFADSYGRIVFKEMSRPTYSPDSINLIVNDNDEIPSGSMGVYYESLTLSSNEGLTPIKQAIIRNSENDPGYGRFPDQPWETDEFGEYNGKENIVVIEGSIFVADLKKNDKMTLSRILLNRIIRITNKPAAQAIPYPYNKNYAYGNNVMPKYDISGVTFNPYYEPGDPIFVNYELDFEDALPYKSIFYSYLLNMDISMSNGFKFNTQNDLEYDTHWIKFTPSGFNIEDPESSGISGGGSGSGGLSAFAVNRIPESPRSNTIYFIVTED